MPWNLPFNSGSTSATALAAPVVVGMIESVGGARAPLVLVRRVEDHLVLGVGMHGGHEAGLDTERVAEHLGDRSQAVGRARRVRDDVVLGGVVRRVVDAHADGDVLVLRRSGDHHLPGSRVDVALCPHRVAEEPRRLDDDVDAEIPPGKPLRVSLGEHLDDLPVHRDAVSIGSNRSGESTEHAVVLEQVGQHLGGRDVVDGDDLEIGGALSGGTQHVAPDAAEAVDANSHSHAGQPPVVR